MKEIQEENKKRIAQIVMEHVDELGNSDCLASDIEKLLVEEREKNQKIIEWATGEDTGSSSKALCRFMLGIPSSRNYPCPYDADDRGRCIRLLNLIPEWWDRLDEMESIPSLKVNVFSGNGFEVREEGWKEQIPLIKKEAGK